MGRGEVGRGEMGQGEVGAARPWPGERDGPGRSEVRR